MKKMSMENWIRVIAGTIVLVSLFLGLFVNKWWFLLNLFVGLNLIQSAFTGFCTAEIFLSKLGVKKEKDM